LDEDTIFGLSGSGNLFDIFADVKVSEVGESKVKGLTIKKSNNNIKIAVKGTRVATQKTEQKPLEATPAAEEKKKGNPFLEKQKDLLDSLGKVQVDLK
jgi:bisphosphoglycerate-dependent phosphoglycerate mutase